MTTPYTNSQLAELIRVNRDPATSDAAADRILKLDELIEQQAKQALNLPPGVRVAFSWSCPDCDEWSHGWESPDLAAQELLEHQDERHG